MSATLLHVKGNTCPFGKRCEELDKQCLEFRNTVYTYIGNVMSLYISQINA